MWKKYRGFENQVSKLIVGIGNPTNGIAWNKIGRLLIFKRVLLTKMLKSCT